MTNVTAAQHEEFPDHHHDLYSKTVFGFWIYLLTDFMMFATFFASYVVLRHSTYGGPSAKELFEPSFALVQMLILLTSSFTSGMGGAAAHRKDKSLTLALFTLTFLLGIAFMGLEIADFMRLIDEGNSWQKSAFLSMFFTLVGTHGIHMLVAILWVVVLLIPVWHEGITSVSIRRLTCLRMFWQFLNIVWVFIFAIVYFMAGG